MGHQGQVGQYAGVQAARRDLCATRSSAIRTPRATPPRRLVENSKQAVADGWKFVRWGQPETGGILEYRSASDPLGQPALLEPVESIRIAEEQFAMVREAVGPDIQLCFDAHTRLDTAHFVTMCRALEPYNPFFIEGRAKVGEPGQLPHAGEARISAVSGRRAVGVQVVVPRGDRGRTHQLRPDRPVHSRRADRGSQDYPHGGDALH